MEAQISEFPDEQVVEPKAAQRFEHYEVEKGEDGMPLELGRGAMGVTYKAFDVNLQCPVTLKVINEKFLCDESARLRFVREARAAASVRHPNVASVFHLGRTGDNYFYAMEFVEGETLQSFIRRSGHVETKTALQITTQIAAGLTAVHKQKLVHRDIKPSNIIVSLGNDAVTAKIIDLGLAKSANEPDSQSAISTPGGFAGTPEFASPEQLAGVSVDIRSDLYSLGVTIWEMVTGRPLFKGSPAEVTCQHQQASLPLGQLRSVPQPMVMLIEVLLEEDPVRRFQSPAELLRVLPAIVDALDGGRTISYQSLRETPASGSYPIAGMPPVRRGPEKVSVARLPVTGSAIFGREEDIAFLDDAWTRPNINVVSVVAWAGVGKSTLINHWLRGVAAGNYRSAELVFGWSFYTQGSGGDTSSADEFLDTALAWFGDPDPRIGTAWQRGERLANLVARRRTLLVLDGLEPLQYPPGPREGRIREPSLQALLRELAEFNMGLCIVTTRIPIADIADHESTSAPRRELEQVSCEAGARLLRALGVRGEEAELRSASEEFSGHCLALTLLGSYLVDACNGEIRHLRQVSDRLADDVRQGVHAKKVMESYQVWLGEGPELSVLRMLGLFDRPADQRALGTLLRAPAVPGLTEPLTHLSPAQWQMVLAKLRRARLLAGEDPHDPGRLDTHPLVREYFGEQLKSQRTGAWKECNKRLYNYYRERAPHLPDSFAEMEPLFLAVICGCKAGLFRDALHEVYMPRIQRGNASFAANVPGGPGALLSVLVHFFEQGSWGSLAETDIEGQSLTAEDQLFILIKTALSLTATRGLAAPEARICYERAESLCHSLNRPLMLYVTLMGQWRYCFMTDKLSATLKIAQRIYSLAQEQNNLTLTIGSHSALANTLYFSGDFEGAREHAMSGVQIWRSGRVQSPIEDISAPAVICLCYEAHCKWHLGKIASSHTTMDEAISLAKELNHTHALATALFFAMILHHFERNPAKVKRLASELIEFSTRHSFAHWLALGKIYHGWARSVLGDTADGLLLIEDGVRDFRATGSMLGLSYFLAAKAEALHLADRTPEALEAISEAEAFAEEYEERSWCAELHRLRGVFLAAIGASETKIEASFFEAERMARQQNSTSLAARAAASRVEYRREKKGAASCQVTITSPIRTFKSEVPKSSQTRQQEKRSSAGSDEIRQT